MSIHFRASTTTIDGSTPVGTAFETVPTTFRATEAAVPAQFQWSPHLAAVFGIFALAVLGGWLVARNRLTASAGFATESEQRHDEFLSDRERVQQLVRDNGGRMKQSKIVDSVDWSKAKVSRLLAELEEEGRITKLRLGRENLVCLPGHEPTASQSPEQPKNE